MAKQSIILLFIFLLSGCSRHQFNYCIYEEPPFKIEANFNSTLNQIENLEVMTTVDLKFMDFNTVESDHYLEQFTEIYADDPKMTIEKFQNTLIIKEMIEGDRLKCQDSYFYGLRATLEHFEHHNFDCH